MRFVFLCFIAAACSTRGLTDQDTPPRDAVAPVLDIRTPLRGSIAAGATTIEVRGVASDADSGLQRVLVNDYPVVVGPNGDFVAEVQANPGLTLIHTVATDKAGNTQSDTRAVLGGTLAPIDTTVSHAFYAHVDGKSLALVGGVASKALTDMDIGARVMALNPIVDIPIDCLGAKVAITKVTKGKVTVSVVPDNDGLSFNGEIDGIEVDLHVDYDLACDKGSADVKVTANAFHVGGILAVSLDAAGAVTVNVSQESASFDGFKLDTSVLPDGIDNLIGTPLGTALSGIIADLVDAQVPGLLSKLIGGEQRIDVDGQTLSVTLTPTALHVDAGGLDVALDSKVYMPGDNGIEFLVDTATAPPLDTSKPFRAALADNALNQVLTALWGVGLMDQTFTVDAGSYAGLGKIFDHVELALRLPPVITALPANGGLAIAVGDVECKFLLGDKVVTRLAMSAQTALTTSIAANKLSMVAGDPVVWLDFLSDGVAGANPFDNDDVQQLGSFAAKNLVGVLTSYIGKVPLPSVDGISIMNAQVTTGPTTGGYVMVTADLKGP